MLITVAEMKEHLNIDSSETDYDDLLTDIILATIKFIEAETGRTLTQVGIDSPPVYATQKFSIHDIQVDDFGAQYLELEKVPVLSVQSVQYVDDNGSTQTWSSSLWELDTDKLFGRVFAVFNQVFPSARNQRNAFTVTYDAGYTEAEGIPENMKHAGKMLATSLFYNRENDSALTIKNVPIGAERLLQPYKIKKV